MKKIVILMLILLSGITQHVVGQTFAGGDGTSANPYQVATAAHLNEVRNYLTANFIQTAEIDLSSYGSSYDSGQGWVPIGTDATNSRFRGVYDGGGFKIKNLYINRPGTANVGLFGCLEQGTLESPVVIRRVNLEDVVSVNGARGTGSLVGRVRGNIYSLIEGCSVVGATGSYVRGHGATGGLVGANNSFEEQPGGTNNPIVSQCHAYITVEAKDGGGGDKIGGLVGCNQKGTTINSYAFGEVKVVGSGTFQRVGGLAGCTDLRGRITNSYSTGSVTPTASTTLVGGLVGHLGSGGAGNRGTVTNSYWLEGAYNSSAGGTVLTDAQMKQSSSFTGWDFTTIWNIDNGFTYPFLRPLTSTNYVIWEGISSSEWNTNTNWSPNRVPESGDVAIIPSGKTYYPVITSAITVPAISVNVSTGGTITVNPGGQLTIEGSLNNATNNYSGIVIESTAAGSGSIIHTTNDVQGTIKSFVSGSATLSEMQYHQVSVPLTQASNPTSNLFLGSYLYGYNSTNQAWYNVTNLTTIPLEVNQGYLIYYPGPDITYEFAGTMNNGAFPIPLTFNTASGYTGFNLVPNPYPSAIDWDAASGWTKTNLNNAIWIWNPSTKNYASYVNGSGTNNGTRFIPVGQAFFVQANAGGPALTVTNAARVHSSQAFFKGADDRDAPASLLRMGTSANGYSDEIILRLHPEATQGHDSQFDAVKMFGAAEAPQLYSLTADEQKLSISSMPYDGMNISIPLGFELQADGPVTFSFHGAESFTSGMQVVLEDTKTGEMLDLHTAESYSFAHEQGHNPLRFVVHIGKHVTTGTDRQQLQPGHQIFTAGKQVFIRIPSLDSQPVDVELFDMLGRRLTSARMMLGTEAVLDAGSLSGIVIVRVSSGDEVFTQRVMLK